MAAPAWNRVALEDRAADRGHHLFGLVVSVAGSDLDEQNAIWRYDVSDLDTYLAVGWKVLDR